LRFWQNASPPSKSTYKLALQPDLEVVAGRGLKEHRDFSASWEACAKGCRDSPSPLQCPKVFDEDEDDAGAD
jgi:hypothetical protein